MARRVFFSFHHEADCWRVNQVRMANVVGGFENAGFYDESEYDDLRTKGEAAIRAAIRKKLDRSSVTVVLVGAFTAFREWVQWEVNESVKRGNGLLAVYIHHLKDRNGLTTSWGLKPVVDDTIPFPAILWNSADLSEFRRQVEAAGVRFDRAQGSRIADWLRPLSTLPPANLAPAPPPVMSGLKPADPFTPLAPPTRWGSLADLLGPRPAPPPVDLPPPAPPRVRQGLTLADLIAPPPAPARLGTRLADLIIPLRQGPPKAPPSPLADALQRALARKKPWEP